MKSGIGFIAAALLLCISGGRIWAQDIITLRNGEDLKARITEVLGSEVRYKDYDNQDGPVLTVNKSDILMITYQNGMREVIEHVSSSGYGNGGYYSDGFRSSGWYGIAPAGRLYATSAESLRPNMKYSELKNIYSHDSYDGYMTGDPYYGQCYLSIIMPGLGQMVMGETGRGAAFLGAEIGCYALTIAGGITMLCSIGASADRAGGELAIGRVMTVAGCFGVVATYVYSIVDAVNVMKVKNMYARDMRGAAYGMDLKLSPWVSPVSMGANGNSGTAAGLSLTMRF